MKLGYIQTFTGRKVFPLNLDPADIAIEDIAHALSMQCRFGGHVREFYSVAEHSIRCAHLVPQDQALHALLHDASEAYLMDMTRPVKYQPEMSAYRDVEKRCERALAIRFGIPEEKTPEIERADKALLVAETRDLMPEITKDYRPEWLALPEVARIHLNCLMTSEQAENVFLLCYEMITAPLRVGTM
jgi:uncharacterized protein